MKAPTRGEDLIFMIFPMIFHQHRLWTSRMAYLVKFTHSVPKIGINFLSIHRSDRNSSVVSHREQITMQKENFPLEVYPNQFLPCWICIKFIYFQLGYSAFVVAGFVTGCPCNVWYHGLTNHLHPVMFVQLFGISILHGLTWKLGMSGEKSFFTMFIYWEYFYILQTQYFSLFYFLFLYSQIAFESI